MAAHYQGRVIQLADAIKFLAAGQTDRVWTPGEDRIRLPPQASQNDFDDLFRIADKFKVSDLTLQVGEPAWAEIANTKYKMTSRPLAVSELSEYLRAIYDITGPGEVVQRGRPIDAAFVVREEAGNINSRKIRVRLNATGGRNPLSDSEITPDGMQLTCRILPGTPPSMEGMGVEQAIIDGFKPLPELLPVWWTRG